MREFGYEVGNQAQAETMIEDWSLGNFNAIVRYCKDADFFQDIPFSLARTYEAVDRAYPGSKFILTVRSSAEEWYQSLLRFHSKNVAEGRQPTADALKSFSYRAPGWLWQVQQLVYGVDESHLYDRTIYKDYYDQHNDAVREYFRGRPGDFLELDLSWPDALERLCAFLGLSAAGKRIPHLNRSK